MKLTMLGTAGGAIPRLHRYMSSIAVEIGEDVLLLDCGAGATYQLVRAGIKPNRVQNVFLTHHHHDHILDLGQLALTAWQTGGAQPLQIFGPRRTEHIVRLLFDQDDGVYAEDIRSRINVKGGQKLNESREGGRLAWPAIHASDVEAGPVASHGAWSVDALGVPHLQPDLESIAFRIRTDEGVVVYTGDTRVSAAMAQFAAGADVLIHECSHPDYLLRQTGLDSNHTGPTGAASVARDAGVRHLVLTHFAPELDDAESLKEALDRASEVFSGEISLANDLDVIAIGG